MLNALEVTLQPSLKLKRATLVGLLLLAVFCAMADILIAFKLIAMAYLLVAGCWVYFRWVLLAGPRAITAIRCSQAGWWVHTVQAGWQQAELIARNSVMTARVIALEFEVDRVGASNAQNRLIAYGRAKSLHSVILNDSVSSEQHRQLRLLLRAQSAC